MSDHDYWSDKSSSYRESYTNPKKVLDFEKGERLENAIGLAPAVKRGRILNIGVGAGLLFPEIDSDENEVVGIDFSKEMIESSRERHQGVEYIQGSGDALPLEDNSISLVFCLGVVGHMSEGALPKLVSESARVLEDGGVLVFSFANSSSPLRKFRDLYQDLRGVDYGYSTYSPQSVKREIQRNGFSVEDSRYITFAPGLTSWSIENWTYLILERILQNKEEARKFAMTWLLSCRKTHSKKG